MDVIFLGVNDVGMRIYEWLCDRSDTTVLLLLTEQEQLDVVRRESPDMLVSVGFDHLVPAEILSIPSEGAINLHPSLLPHNRGKSPNVWSIIDDTPAGVTLHTMDEEIDTGGIIAQREVDIDFADTGKDLHRRLEEAQLELFTDVWPSIVNDTVDVTPQAEAGSYHTVEDFRQLCELDPEETVQVKPFLDRLRALTFPPFDNAYLEVDGQKYYVEVNIRRGGSDEERTDGMIRSY